MPLDSLNLGFVVPLNIEFSIMYFILGMRWPNAIGIRIGQTICGLSNTLYSAFCLALRQGFSTYPGCPATYQVGQAGLRFTEIPPLPKRYSAYRMLE